MIKIALNDKQKERVNAFIAALKSGNYKKITGQLKKDDSFCAWGLGAEIYRQRTKNGHYRWIGDYLVDNRNGYRFHTTPPDEIVEYYGLEEMNLLELNDGKKLSFSKIGDKLKKLIA